MRATGSDAGLFRGDRVAHGAYDLGRAQESVHFALEVHVLVTPDRFEIFHSFGVELENPHDDFFGDNFVELDLDFAA